MKLSSLALVDLRVDNVPSLAEMISREGHLFKIVVEGESFAKLRENGTLKSSYVLRFDSSCLVLFAGAKKQIDVCALKEVRLGFLTQPFLSFAEKHRVDENAAFSLLYEVEGSPLPKVLNLVCATKEKRDMWVHALRVLIQTVSAMNAECYSLMRPWIGALKKEPTLDSKAVLALLDSLNIPSKKCELKKGEKLGFSDFISLVRRLRAHPAVSELYEGYRGVENFLTVNQLKRFAAIELGEEWSIAQTEAVIAKFGNGVMDELALQKYLISSDNSVWNPEKERHTHNMDRKLSDYFINSSHNTYLSGSQLNSISSIEMYVRALKLGCRCLEIDIWDGPNGEPIVYHGFTLTSKILFRDVLRVIRSHGFVFSPFPLILSFENHCSKAQQDKMASYLKEILGGMLGKWEGGSELRSPSALRSKVLIKGSNHVANSIELLEDMEEMRVEIQKGATLTKEEIAFLEEKMAEKTNRPDDEENSHISSELEALIYLRAKKLPKFPLGYDSFQPNFMTSFGENRINKILRDNDGIMHLRAFNAKHISRVYPKGTRFDSSNYDPVLYWFAGCQMLALNFQSSTEAPMLINWAKFRENGNVGYTLRPECLNEVVRASGSVQFGSLFAKVERFRRPDPICKKLIVQIFGGRQFPNSRSVWIEMYVCDGTIREDRYRSSVFNDSFAPDFNFTCEIPIVDSANAYLVIVAHSKEEGGFGFFCVPVECMRLGYRAVHLVDKLYEPINKGMCHLLCKFSHVK